MPLFPPPPPATQKRIAKIVVVVLLASAATIIFLLKRPPLPFRFLAASIDLVAAAVLAVLLRQNSGGR